MAVLHRASDTFLFPAGLVITWGSYPDYGLEKITVLVNN